jgi:creatinine amidohydrolase
MAVQIHNQSWPQVRALIDKGAVVVVPVGALEQHGPHLPLGTDYRMAEAVAIKAAERACAEGSEAVVTPPVWHGYSPHHMGFAGSVTLRAETLLAVLTDVGASLWQHGFRKILFLNGHGGNANLLGAAVQKLRFEHGVRAAGASYWSFAAGILGEWRQSDPGGIDHACEMEMSLMLHVAPQDADAHAVADGTWFPQSEFLSGDLAIGAPVSVAWSFDELTDDGTLGDPTKASAERGEELFDAIVGRVAAFLQEFQTWDWNAPRSI